MMTSEQETLLRCFINAYRGGTDPTLYVVDLAAQLVWRCPLCSYPIDDIRINICPSCHEKIPMHRDTR
jgi:rubrerythrin